MHFARLMLGIGLLALAARAPAQPDELLTGAQDQTAVSVTIYNADLALIKDTRSLSLLEGPLSLAWRDVSARMRPETALLRDLSDGQRVTELEQNFDYDLLTPQTLLQKYVGRKVKVLTTNPSTGVQSSEEATVLAANEGVVLRFADRIESSPNGRIAFAGLPEDLRDRPTLVLELSSSRAGRQDLELSYLTGGLSWKADYVAELSETDDFLDLNGWVTLTNQSGAAYRNARLQLVAGDVNRVFDSHPMQAAGLMRLAAPAPAVAKMAEESLLDYHLYTLERPTTMLQNQTKQVALLSAPHVAVTKEYRLRGADYYYRSSAAEIGRQLKVSVLVHFTNAEPSLGMPLPKGVIRVYKKDRDGRAQFVGEDQIDHTPKNEPVQLKLGEAFDVTATKRQVDFQRAPGVARDQFVYESAFEFELHNAKSSAVSVHIQEPIPGDWEMLTESEPHTKESANLAGWVVNVGPQARKTLTFRVRVKL